MKILQLTFTIFLCFILCSCLNRVAGSKQVVELDGKTYHVWELKGGNAYEAYEFNLLATELDPAFQKKNLLAIEKVSGGKIDPYTIITKPNSIITQAVVIIDDNSSVK